MAPPRSSKAILTVSGRVACNDVLASPPHQLIDPQFFEVTAVGKIYKRSVLIRAAGEFVQQIEDSGSR
jgi:hypothetical protein